MYEKERGRRGEIERGVEAEMLFLLGPFANAPKVCSWTKAPESGIQRRSGSTWVLGPCLPLEPRAQYSVLVSG